MRVLFVVPDLYFSEPLGVMILSAVCKQHGHETRALVIKSHLVDNVLNEFQPDIIAYSCMTTDEPIIARTDTSIRDWAARENKKILRIMGGAHPTFFHQVLHNMDLDAICVGDGERAIISIIEAFANDGSLDNIPNVITAKSYPNFQKEIVENMDEVPFADRAIFYDADPDLQHQGIRSFLTQKGCPYKCTYCFNHAYNRMFKGDGRKIMRRRSVDSLLKEIKGVMKDFPVVRFIRFADDVFSIRKDDWLEEFAEKYPKEIGLPFYCLIRCNSLTEDIAALLAKAGCKSISMSIEAGTEKVRNDILKRNMPDEMMVSSFNIARKYGLNAFANTILAVPGTNYDDDFHSIQFSKKLNPACPTFGVFSPFPGTDLTQYAIEIGELDPDYDYAEVGALDTTVLKSYSDEERMRISNLTYLGQIFCKLPDFMMPSLHWFARRPWTPFYKFIGALFFAYIMATRTFPGAYPRNPVQIFKSLMRALRYLLTRAEKIKGETNLRTPAQGFTSPDY